MKNLTHTDAHLVFRHVPIGLAVMMGLLIAGGVAAGVAAISMHETLAITDDFIRIGLGLVFGTLILGGLVTWKAVRIRRLTFDRAAAELRLESRGLGRPRLSSWSLANLVRVEVASIYLSGSGNRHSTRLVFDDGQTVSLGSMDPPTYGRIKRNVEVMNTWLSGHFQSEPGPSPRA